MEKLKLKLDDPNIQPLFRFLEQGNIAELVENDKEFANFFLSWLVPAWFEVLWHSDKWEQVIKFFDDYGSTINLEGLDNTEILNLKLAVAVLTILGLGDKVKKVLKEFNGKKVNEVFKDKMLEVIMGNT